jgi:uncharacterized protein (DUF1778 family)
MLGKPDLRQQCHLAIDAMPDAGLGETLERLHEVAEFHGLRLSERDVERFLASLRSDAMPNAALLRTFERSKAATRE